MYRESSSLLQHNTDTDKRTSESLAIHTGRDEDGNSQMTRQCTGCTCSCRAEPLAGSQKADGPTQPHGSITALHQQVKMLQKKLRTVNKQVRYILGYQVFLSTAYMYVYIYIVDVSVHSIYILCDYS